MNFLFGWINTFCLCGKLGPFSLDHTAGLPCPPHYILFQHFYSYFQIVNEKKLIRAVQILPSPR